MAVSTKIIKQRIRSIKNTHKMTRAMEMVSASKMRKAVGRSLASRPYAWRALELLVNISKDRVLTHPLLTVREPVKKVLLIIVAANKGLCGSFNVNIFRFLHEYIQQEVDKQIKVEAVTVGKYAERYAKKLGLPVVGSFIDIQEDVTVEQIRGLSKLVEEEFSGGKYDQVRIVYTNYISVLKNEVVSRGLLPIRPEHITLMIEQAGAYKGNKKEEQDKIESMSLYLFEPSEDEVLNLVLPILTEVQLYQALLESQASEHSARMMAMRNASEAAEDMIRELTLTYNKARQESITKEISEIAAGAEALKQL